MAAGWRRRRQPPARNLRRAGPGRAAHLRTDAGPGQRHAGGNQPPVDAAADAPKPPSPCRASWPRPRAPGRLERLAGRDGRRAAPEWQQAGADAASRQREICDALLLAAQDISEQGRAQASGTLAEINRGRCRRRGAKAAVALQAELVARDRPGRVDRHAGRDGRNAAPNGSRPAPMPPAASSRSARRWPTPPARSRINRAPTPATRWPRSTA